MKGLPAVLITLTIVVSPDFPQVRRANLHNIVMRDAGIEVQNSGFGRAESLLPDWDTAGLLRQAQFERISYPAFFNASRWTVVFALF